MVIDGITYLCLQVWEYPGQESVQGSEVQVKRKWSQHQSLVIYIPNTNDKILSIINT